MRTLVVSYDLNKPGQDYAELVAKLKTYDLWWHHLDSTWVIVTWKTPEQVRNELIPFLDRNDELLVIQSAKVGAWTGFSTKGSDWLMQNL